MATSVQPESPNPQENQEVTTPPITNQEPNNTPVQPQTPTVAPEIETLRTAYTGALRDANIRAEQAERELQRLRETQNAPPPSNPDRDVELLTSNPRQLIRETMESIVAPLNQQANQWNRTNTITTLKAQMQADPRFNYIKIRGVEDLLDNLIATTPEINPSTMQALYSMAVGLFIQNGGNLNIQPTQPPAPQPTVHHQTVPTPPQTRPAAPIVPVNQNNNPRSKREYTENERLIMRVNHMTEDEYDAEMGLAPSDVIRGGNNG